MEIVWHSEFNSLFANFYPHSWYLAPTPLCPNANFQVASDSAKVRFLCQECGHGWTSMKGRVIFWFNLNAYALEGFVFFKLFGQRCQKCNTERFEHAMWYPEEVAKVLANIYNVVGETYYGFVRPPFFKERRKGKPRAQHPAELCQACQLGICSQMQKQDNTCSVDLLVQQFPAKLCIL